ncbi:MAG: transposase [Nitrosomonas sp.]|nr:transposase [Nitrosomonas sp.]
MRLFIAGLSLADSFVTRRTRKGNFLNQIDQLIDWTPIEKTIAQYYAPVSDATDRPAYPGLLLLKMLLVGLWHGGLSDESVEDMANANRHDSQPMLALLDKAGIKPGNRLHGDKAYGSQKHREALKARGIKNGIQDKTVRNKPLTA